MKKMRILAAAGAGVLLLGGVIFAFAMGRRPFKDLDADQVAFATVQLTPPDTTLQVVDTAQLAAYLQDVVIYQPDNSYTEYTGQGVTFALTMADGSQTRVMAYNPFLVIDGVGYKTAYQPCEALNAYANRLLEEGTAPVVLEEPPALSVVSDHTVEGALLGGYHWQRPNPDGTTTAQLADCPHPLACQELLSPAFETASLTATLRFHQPPDGPVTLHRWSDIHWGDPTAEGEPVELTGEEFTLKPGGYIYEATAQWNNGVGGGTASYWFYINYAV